jgi:uncharacterized protein (TIGR02598 family)
MRSVCMGNALSKSKAGFSLIEVAIALAIASFVLLAIFAMIYVAQQGSKASSDDARLSTISQQVFHQVQIDLATQAAFTTPPSPWTQIGASTSYQRYYWFDSQGDPQPTATSPGVLYQAAVVLGPLATYPPNVDSTILKSLVITINWPPTAWASTTAPARSYSILLRNRGSYGNSPIDTPP